MPQMSSYVKPFLICWVHRGTATPQAHLDMCDAQKPFVRIPEGPAADFCSNNKHCSVRLFTAQVFYNVTATSCRHVRNVMLSGHFTPPISFKVPQPAFLAHTLHLMISSQENFWSFPVWNFASLWTLFGPFPAGESFRHAAKCDRGGGWPVVAHPRKQFFVLGMFTEQYD